VADLGIVRLSGFVAWVLWLFIHLLYLVEFENRVLVLVQWAWSYFTWNRGARLITGEHGLRDLPGWQGRESDARGAAPVREAEEASSG
jgi:NADH dehydrogenase